MSVENELGGPEGEIESAKKRKKRGGGFSTEGRSGKPWNREEARVFQSVFGKNTLLALYKLINDGHFSELHGEFNSGKEASIFSGIDRYGKFVAVKIYRIEASDFSNMLPYLKGDKRFENIGNSKKEIVFAWNKKEFSNLRKMEEEGVRVPHPIAFLENVLVFELVTDEESGGISPQLKKAYQEISDPAGFSEQIVLEMEKMHRAGFVHSDLSEYNILVSGGRPVIIDCGQAVLLTHPNAQEFLERDCENVSKFLSRKLGYGISKEELLKRVLSSRKSEGEAREERKNG